MQDGLLWTCYEERQLSVEGYYARICSRKKAGRNQSRRRVEDITEWIWLKMLLRLYDRHLRQNVLLIANRGDGTSWRWWYRHYADEKSECQTISLFWYNITCKHYCSIYKVYQIHIKQHYIVDKNFPPKIKTYNSHYTYDSHIPKLADMQGTCTGYASIEMNYTLDPHYNAVIRHCRPYQL